MIRFAALFLAIAFASVAQAQQFKWVDKDGKTQYGDAPPPGVKATSLKAPPGPTAPPAAPASKDAKDGKAAKKSGPMSAKEQEAAFRQRQDDQRKAADKSAKADAEEGKRKENCEAARGRLRDLEGGVRIASTNEKGERVFMEDGARAREITGARQSVAEWCK